MRECVRTVSLLQWGQTAEKGQCHKLEAAASLPLPLADLQFERRLRGAGLDSAGAARQEGPAAASSLDRSWLSAETALRLFPAQLQALLQLRCVRPADVDILGSLWYSYNL